MERWLMVQYDKAEAELDLYWRQRSRTQWAQQGDRNTAFFHVVATQRRQHNNITSISNHQGVQLTDDKQVCKEFVSYFRFLYATGLGHTDEEVEDLLSGLRAGPVNTIPVWAKIKMGGIPSSTEIKRHTRPNQFGEGPGPI
jgi:hypothetical protein